MKLALLLLALVSYASARSGFGSYATDQTILRPKSTAEVNSFCRLPCVANTSESLKFFDVHWYAEYDKEFRSLRDWDFWHDKDIRYVFNYPTRATEQCTVREDGLMDCSHILTHCTSENVHFEFDRNYQCSIQFLLTGETFNVTSTIPAYHFDEAGQPSCYLPEVENIAATFYYQGEIPRVNVSWDVTEKPPAQKYCEGSRQFSIRVLEFDSPEGIRDNDTRLFNRYIPFIPLGRRVTHYQIPRGINLDKYYLFQVENGIKNLIIRNYSSSIYYFKEQVVPYFVNTDSNLQVARGGNVEIVCEARGYPPPVVHLYRNLERLPLVENRYPLVSVSEFELGNYICAAHNYIVNPPLGKRRRTANKWITLEFSPEPVQTEPNCVAYAGSYCRNYLYRDTTVYANTSKDLEAIIGDYSGSLTIYYIGHAEKVETEAYSNISQERIDQCFNFITALACSVVYPYCDHRETIRPVCKHSCEQLQNECNFFLDPELLPDYHFELRNLKNELLSNCDSRENPGGSSPECTYISLEKPNIAEDDQLTQAKCVSGKGRGYNGNEDRTASGIECQAWAAQSPQQHSIRPAHHPTELLSAGFGCRNPGGRGERPWCFTTNPNKRWEYCDIPQCEQCNAYSGGFCAGLPGYSDNTVYTNSIDWPTGIVTHQALESKMNSLYTSLVDAWTSPGCQHATRTLICHGTLPLCSQQGEPRSQCNEHCTLFQEMLVHCQQSLTNELARRWNSTLATERLNQPNCALETGSGQCLPPPERIEPSTNQHPECYNSSDRGQTYTGDIALSLSGKTCMSWSQAPLIHSYSGLTENFCRNPGQWRATPWCFTEDNTLEECGVPPCLPTVDDPRGVPGAGGQSDTGTVVGVSLFLVALLVIGIIIAVLAIMRFARKREISHSPFQPCQVSSDKMKDMEYRDNDTYMQGTMALFPRKVAEAIATFQQIPQDKIEYVKQLGQGFFGMVFKGKLKSEVEGDPEMFVAVKTLKEDCNDGIEGFVNEAKLMFGFDHQNIVQILGVSMMKTPYYLVFEYMDKGDLAKFLRENASSLQRRHMSPTDRSRSRTESTLSDDPASLNNTQLIDLCQQIASGMQYLSSLKHVHRDLACRNCLVKSIPDDGTTVTESKVIVKIGDFGLSHNLYSKDYYRVRGQAVLPIRWMSPEAIVYGKFSTAGDVWSFGVVMWEIFAFGIQPYYGISNEEVMERVRFGRVLQPPVDCPDRVYSIMSECWASQDINRPTFDELCKLLQGCELESTSSEIDAQSMMSYDSGDVFEAEDVCDIEA